MLIDIGDKIFINPAAVVSARIIGLDTLEVWVGNNRFEVRHSYGPDAQQILELIVDSTIPKESIPNSAPQKPSKAPVDHARVLKTVSEEFPCVTCHTTKTPPQTGCGRADCPHDEIPF